MEKYCYFKSIAERWEIDHSYTGMSIVFQALRKHQIVIFKSEFGIIRDDDFIRIEIDGWLMQASAIRFVFFPLLWIFTKTVRYNHLHYKEFCEAKTK